MRMSLPITQSVPIPLAAQSAQRHQLVRPANRTARISALVALLPRKTAMLPVTVMRLAIHVRMQATKTESERRKNYHR
jgi:hypothetical protein